MFSNKLIRIPFTAATFNYLVVIAAWLQSFKCLPFGLNLLFFGFAQINKNCIDKHVYLHQCEFFILK